MVQSFLNTPAARQCPLDAERRADADVGLERPYLPSSKDARGYSFFFILPDQEASPSARASVGRASEPQYHRSYTSQCRIADTETAKIIHRVRSVLAYELVVAFGDSA